MLITLGDDAPQLDPTCWVAPGAVLAGRVELGERASVWYATVVRAEGDRITIGAGSNIQDGSVLHTDPGFHLEIGPGVTVGHRAVLHGCRVEQDVLVGMGAVVMNGAVIGAGSMVAAGALVPAGTVVPPRSLVVGAPGRVRRATTDDELVLIRANAQHYEQLVALHRAGSQQVGSRAQQ
ncbi:MAG TPA: gamma carbonic anhydrase family protein [Mycobacteriales bacterium]|nr:gamma carbonic anhydrase family protein [Mycobacteriales bacterium]